MTTVKISPRKAQVEYRTPAKSYYPRFILDRSAWVSTTANKYSFRIKFAAIVLLGSVAFLIGALLNDTANSGWALLLIGVSVPLFQATRALTPAEAP